MLVEVERPHERYMQHDSGRAEPGPAPISNVTKFHCSDGALSAMFALHQKVDFPGFIPPPGRLRPFRRLRRSREGGL